MNVIISFEIMNIWFQHMVNYHCFPHLARIALKVIVSKAIVNRNTSVMKAVRSYDNTDYLNCHMLGLHNG